MNSRLFLTLIPVGISLLASCYPYPEGPPQGKPTSPQGEQTLSSEEQQKIEAQRDRMREQAAQREQQQRQAEQQTERRETPPPTSEPTRRSDYPFATPVPGKDGFVFSPYNNKVVDVRDIPSGTLVQDPTYPPADKKYFRVP